MIFNYRFFIIKYNYLKSLIILLVASYIYFFVFGANLLTEIDIKWSLWFAQTYGILLADTNYGYGP
jgi:hypothetical protein